MLNAIALIAERRISEAIRKGELEVPEHLRGRPLPEEDMRLVAPELRMAYKILKNAGYLPPEVEMRKEAARLEELIAVTEDEHERLRQMKKLEVIARRMASMRDRPLNLGEGDYQRKVVERIQLRRQQEKPEPECEIGCPVS